MLIYNHQKEFLGISEEDLSILGFSNLSQLRKEASDFADLFVKTPGFVHNFKHVHWIDFVACAESSEDSKVIIQANDKNFMCILDIQITYLIDEPAEKAFIINLINLREASQNENVKIPAQSTQNSVSNAPAPKKKPVVQKQEVIEEEIIEETVAYTPPPSPQVEVENIVDDTPLDLAGFDDFDADFSELNDIDLDDVEEVETVREVKAVQKPKPVAKPIEDIYVKSLNAGMNYIYDPQVASDELGLPVDLIEEFIEDFIAQAYEFKDELYISLKNNDIDNVKVLSHKLKGVAANLRIEDGFEVLATINTSDDTDEIFRNMNTLYLIVDKLDGKEVQIQEPEETEEISISDDDDFIIDFKEDNALADIDEPSEIEIPDLDEELSIDMSDFDNDDDLLIDDIASEPISSVQYNKNSVAKDIGIDKSSFDELFNDYTKEAQNICLKIKNAVTQSDAKLWKHDAIILKGMSDNMRIDDLKIELESIINTTNQDVAEDAIYLIDTKLKQLSQMEG